MWFCSRDAIHSNPFYRKKMKTGRSFFSSFSLTVNDSISFFKPVKIVLSKTGGTRFILLSPKYKKTK